MELPEYKASPTLSKFHQDDSPVRLVMGPVGCYSGDTEYLTPTGWKRFDSGQADLVAQYDPETDKVSFVAPEAWQEIDAPNLFKVRIGQVEQIVSPEHSVVFFKDGMAQKAMPQVLPDERIGVLTAATFSDVGAGLPNVRDDHLRLQAICLIAATWGKCHATRMVARVVADTEHQMRMACVAFEALGLKPTVTSTDGEWIIRCRAPWRIDVIPTAWWHLSTEQIKVVFNTIAEWRAADGTFEFATADRRFRDWLQYAAFISGWESWQEPDGFTLFFRQQRLQEGVPSVAELPGGKAYCCTVPGGCLVVRYKGRVFVSGNSGKSVGCLAEIMVRAFNTPPCKDGVRRSRCLVGRRTYAQLKSTTINTFKSWWGPLGEFREGSPIKWNMKRKLADGTWVDLEILFMSLEGPVEQVVDKLKSLELTFAFLNEVSEIPFEIVTAVRSRLTRYPKKADLPEGAKPWFGLWMDSNFPSIKSWIYRIFEIERPKGWKVFKQPGALIWDDERQEYVPNPEAENIENLTAGYNYYLEMMQGMPDAQVRSMILAEYSPDVSGKPVYPLFSSREHVAEEELKPHGRSVIIIGCDWGLNPAAVFTMMTEHGALWVLDEIALSGVMFDEFRDKHLVPLLQSKYRSYPVLVVGDPAGQARSAYWNDTVFSNLLAHGIPAQPAWTNDIRTRIQAVSHFLQMRKGFLLSPTCVTLREGFEGGYRYQRVSKLGDIFSEKPEKNEYSHVHDALQYAALYYYADVVRDAKEDWRKRRSAMRPASTIKKRALV